MDIDVLGALAVRENGISITPTAPKPRQVLALLALHADQVVPVSALIEELWAGAPPRSARTTLQTYVLQLRALIANQLPALRAKQVMADTLVQRIPTPAPRTVQAPGEPSGVSRTQTGADERPGMGRAIIPSP